MKLACYLTNGMVFIALCLLVQVQSSVSSFKIARGEQDRIRYDKNYHEMVNNTDLGTMTCDGEQESCECKGKDGYNTVIYNTSKNFVKCVKDEAIAIIGQDGNYLTNSNGECLGVKNQKISTTNCTKSDLSLLWLWIGMGQILNLKTLKCLQWHNTSQTFTAEQCKSAEVTQQWTGLFSLDGKVILNFRNLTAKPLNTKETKSSIYKGCYRVSGDKMIALVKRSPTCKDNSQRNCNIRITINAPIFFHKDSNCNILWERSTYSEFGQTWAYLDQKLFALDRINSKETITLKITNSNALFERWPGTLVKLRIKCPIEEHCVLLKIEGEKENVFSTTTTTVIKISGGNNNNDENNDQKSDGGGKDKIQIILILVVCVLGVLFITVVIVFIVYRHNVRHGRARFKKGNTENQDKNRRHITEESAMPLNPLQPSNSNQSTQTESQQYEVPCPHHYEYVDKTAIAKPKIFNYDYASVDGPLKNDQQASVGPDKIGDEDYVIKNDEVETKEEETHDDYVIRDKSYITVIG